MLTALLMSVFQPRQDTDYYGMSDMLPSARRKAHSRSEHSGSVLADDVSFDYVADEDSISDADFIADDDLSDPKDCES